VWCRIRPHSLHLHLPNDRIEDCGSALVGRKTIDLYMPGSGQMCNWGVRNVSIVILTMGSFERSLEILRSRQRSPHVRRMVAKLRALAPAPALVASNRAIAQQG
jgi:hypothetical protein